MYLVVGDLGSNSGEGLDFIDGQTFLERFYSVFGEPRAAARPSASTLTTRRAARHDEQALRYCDHVVHDCYHQLSAGCASKVKWLLAARTGCILELWILEWIFFGSIQLCMREREGVFAKRVSEAPLALAGLLFSELRHPKVEAIENSLVCVGSDWQQSLYTFNMNHIFAQRPVPTVQLRFASVAPSA